MRIAVIGATDRATVRRIALCAAAGAALLIWPEAATTGVRRGLSICTSVLIPSLFPFLVLTGFLVRSGIGARLGRWLERPVRFLFGLPGCCAAGIVMSFLGGYPAGAVAVGELMRQGRLTVGQGKRMLAFCVNAGPAFLLGTVGTGLLGNSSYGVLLLTAHIAAALLIGLLIRRLYPLPPDESPSATAVAEPRASSVALVESVNGACRALLSMSGFVLLFSALLSLADGSGLTQRLADLLRPWAGAVPVDCLLPCLLEVSSGCVAAASVGIATPFWLGMTVGWGGLSVHCQISALLSDHALVDRHFFLARALHALLGGLFSWLLFRYTPMAVSAWAPQTQPWALSESGSVATAVVLLMLCTLCLLTDHHNENTYPAKKR